MKETTNWRAYKVANGFYIFKDKPTNKRINKAVGFVTGKGDELKWFTLPLDIDFKGRKFEEVL
jgi:hypothetical protein